MELKFPATPLTPAPVPNLDGSPQDGRTVMFGDPAGAIGQLIACSSTATDPAQITTPLETTSTGAWSLGFGLLGALGGAAAAFVLRGMLSSLTYEIYHLFRGAIPTIVAIPLLGAIAGGLVGLVIGARFASSVRRQRRGQIPIVTCRIVGTEGIATAHRSAMYPQGQYDVLRFANVAYATVSRARTTTTRTGRHGIALGTSVSHATTITFYDAQAKRIGERRGSAGDGPDGQPKVPPLATGPDWHYAARAVDAWNQWALRRTAEKLQTGQPVSFPLTSGGEIVLTPTRLDVNARGAAPLSAAPSSVQATLAQGKLNLVAPSGRWSGDLGTVGNADVLFGLLASMSARAA